MAPHPLLKPRFWGLWSGSGGSPALRAAAAAFWLAGAAMALAWVVALIHEAVVWGASLVLLIAGLFCAVSWCWLAWSTWFTWRSNKSPITLLWAGPVRKVEADGVTRYVGGFRVAQWQAAVRVDVLVDLQRWMLLRIRSQHVKSPRQAWLWLDAKAPRPEGATPMSSSALHQLRSLLYLPARLTSVQDVASSDSARTGRWSRPGLASPARPLKSGFKLRSAAGSSGSVSKPRTARADAHSVFPPTLIMADERGFDAVARRPGKGM